MLCRVNRPASIDRRSIAGDCSAPRALSDHHRLGPAWPAGNTEAGLGYHHPQPLTVSPGYCRSVRFTLGTAFSALTLLVGRQDGHPKTEWWGAGVVICLERGADLHTAQLMPLPLTVTCFSKIQAGFAFLVPG